VDTPPGSDGARRVVPLVARAGDRVYPSLSLQAVLRHWKVKRDAVRVQLGDAIYVRRPEGEHRIPIDETGGYFVNYRYGIAKPPNTRGFAALIAGWNKAFGEKNPPPDLPDVSARILLIGQVATGLTDLGPTPFSGHTPLVLVHANVIDNILRSDFAHRAQPVWVWLAGVILSVGGLAAFSKRGLVAQGAFSLGVPIVYALIAVWSWSAFNLWLPLVWPLLGFAGVQIFMISRRLIAEQKAKAEIKGMFGTYVSPALVNRMVESGQRPQLGGHEEEITAYFSDIQNFSSFSEKLPPDRLVELMNEYLTACTDIVQEEGGTLDKYIGDAVVAMFGAPIALPDHAYRACVATQRVHQKLGELREKWKSEGDKWPEIVRKMQSRIGLNSGHCIIGNMGSRTRFNYTMMGDNVNLAARMESGAKAWGAYTMCTEATKSACEQHGGDRVVFRALGRIVVMGRSQAVPIFEIVGLKETIAPQTRECIGLFEAALAKYYARDWPAAIEGFRRSCELEPNQPGKTPGVKSNPSLVYISIAEQYAKAPPPTNWEGVFVMTEK
jgi:adenylate cyclase